MFQSVHKCIYKQPHVFNLPPPPFCCSCSESLQLCVCVLRSGRRVGERAERKALLPIQFGPAPVMLGAT